jgi:hypothetical protein
LVMDTGIGAVLCSTGQVLTKCSDCYNNYF